MCLELDFIQFFPICMCVIVLFSTVNNIGVFVSFVCESCMAEKAMRVLGNGNNGNGG